MNEQFKSPEDLANSLVGVMEKVKELETIKEKNTSLEAEIKTLKEKSEEEINALNEKFNTAGYKKISSTKEKSEDLSNFTNALIQAIQNKGETYEYRSEFVKEKSEFEPKGTWSSDLYSANILQKPYQDTTRGLGQDSIINLINVMNVDINDRVSMPFFHSEHVEVSREGEVIGTKNTVDAGKLSSTLVEFDLAQIKARFGRYSEKNYKALINGNYDINQLQKMVDAFNRKFREVMAQDVFVGTGKKQALGIITDYNATLGKTDADGFGNYLTFQPSASNIVFEKPEQYLKDMLHMYFQEQGESDLSDIPTLCINSKVLLAIDKAVDGVDRPTRNYDIIEANYSEKVSNAIKGVNLYIKNILGMTVRVKTIYDQMRNVANPYGITDGTASSSIFAILGDFSTYEGAIGNVSNLYTDRIPSDTDVVIHGNKYWGGRPTRRRSFLIGKQKE